jgi:hypothetical protein
MLATGLHSQLLNQYSDWHKVKCSGRCFLTDSDINLVGYPFVYRLWIEVRDIRGRLQPCAVIDVKSEMDSMEPTDTTKAWFNWIKKNSLPVYIVRISNDWTVFAVREWPNGPTQIMSEKEYIKFIETLTITNSERR